MTEKAEEQHNPTINQAVYLGLLAFGMTSSWTIHPHETLAYHAGVGVGYLLGPYLFGKVVGMIKGRSLRSPAHPWVVVVMGVAAAWLFFSGGA